MSDNIVLLIGDGAEGLSGSARREVQILEQAGYEVIECSKEEAETLLHADPWPEFGLYMDEREPVQEAPEEYDVRNQNKGERKRNKPTRWC
ncbi:MAG: hypothetical protein JKY81_04760 [Colwellia sp.]|nr:hypothetical protein [Colwellia sp.]